VSEEDDQVGKAKFRAAMAWFPSVVPGASAGRTKPEPAKKDNGKGDTTTHDTHAGILVGLEVPTFVGLRAQDG
jgi:hypothetical protein